MMSEKLINIGFRNAVSANKLVAIVNPASAPIKKIIREARARGMLIMEEVLIQLLLRIMIMLSYLLFYLKL
jgi:regulator of extracellular matrix RemA (YlzA/DUF370 family)